MKIYNYSANIKGGLFLLGIVLIAFLLMYSQSIVNKLRNDNREIVQLYAEVIAAAVKDQSNANLSFVFDEIIKKVQFPIIYSDPDKIPIYAKNIDDKSNIDVLKKYQITMDKQNQPIPLEFVNQKTGLSIIIGHLHYGDSTLIKRLQWLPYLEISVVAIFIILGFAGFTMIRNSEKHHIWVGMARETAHQLGTPVSALMGWIDLMKSNPEKTDLALSEMSTDVKRLEQIGDRFSKMGSEIKMVSVKVKNIVENVTFYLNKRLPSMGKNVIMKYDLNDDLKVNGNGILLSWALENIIKNAIDAIDHNEGRINISGKSEDMKIVLQIIDNGKGIPRRDWKNVFRPGFSSKTKGWGLGLSLVKRIIEDMHQGEIKIVESKIGSGTTINISLPAH